MSNRLMLNNLNTSNSNGFTLVELMIALVLGAILLGAVFSAYTTQQESYITQERVAEMQQNLRAAMYPLVDTIRMAGYNPSGNAVSAGITVAEPGRITMLIDWDGDGDTSDTKDRIDFGFPVATDPNNDGIPDDGKPAKLGRQNGGNGGYQPIGENIESIEFLYLDQDGNPTTVLSDIRSIQISLLAISSKPDSDFSNKTEYNPASGVNANWKRATNTDNFRRRLLITTVVCRNIGI